MKKTLFTLAIVLIAVPTLPLATYFLAAADEKKHAHAKADGPLPVHKSPEGAKCYIITPKDGKTVGKTFVVRFGLKGMGVAPAGVAIDNTGHHHLLVDTELKDPKAPIPTPDVQAGSLHFGGGQTETQLTLAPGKHTLRLVLGDMNHVPHDPPVMSEIVTITVE